MNIQNDFDVVVIGSGVGGLCAAGLLSRQKYKVLMLEKRPPRYLGGRCTSFIRKGYNISSGAFWIPLGGAMEQAFRDSGSDFDVVEVPDMDTVYRVEGEDFNLSQGRGTLRRMVGKVADSEAETDKIMSAFRTTSLQKLQYLDRWLSNLTTNERIAGLFQTIAKAFLGVNIGEATINSLLGVIGYERERWGFADNSKMIASMVAAIQANGGAVWCGAEAKQIILEHGKAVAVDIRKKESDTFKNIRVRANYIISDIGPKHTLPLVGEDNLDPDYVSLVKEHSQPLTALAVLVGSDVPLIDNKGILVLNGMKRIAYLTSPSNVIPELAPPGKQLIEICTVPVPSVGSNLSEEERNEESRLAREDISAALPGYEKHGEIVSMMWFEKKWPANRKFPYVGVPIPQETPIENLFNVGDGTSIADFYGFPLNLAAESARVTVRKILKNSLIASLQ